MADGGASEVWHMYVDESGSFDAPYRDVVVVGAVLIPGDLDERIVDDRVRAWLAESFSCSPYPPHQSVLNTPAGVALLLRARPALAAQLGLGGVATMFDGYDPRDRDVLERWKPHQKYPYREVTAFGHWLRTEDRTLFEGLRQYVSECQRRARTKLESALGKEAFVLGAAESDPADPSLDRYIALLQTVLQRAAMLLARPDRDVTITLDVAERWFTPEAVGLPAGAPYDLTPRAVELVARRALAALGPGPSRVGFQVRRTWAYRDPPPGIALADLVANRLRRLVRSPLKWELFVRDVKDSLGVRPEAAVPGHAALPTLAAAGKPERAVLDAYAKLPSADFGSVAPSWAVGQANCWALALRGAQ